MTHLSPETMLEMLKDPATASQLGTLLTSSLIAHIEKSNPIQQVNLIQGYLHKNNIEAGFQLCEEDNKVIIRWVKNMPQVFTPYESTNENEVARHEKIMQLIRENGTQNADGTWNYEGTAIPPLSYSTAAGSVLGHTINGKKVIKKRNPDIIAATFNK